MNVLELHARFQVEEAAIQRALHAHGLISEAEERASRLVSHFPPVLRNVVSLPDAELVTALRQHLAAGEDPNETPGNYGTTPAQRCFYNGKLASMRVLLKAGARIRWTADQIAIALGELPETPNTHETDAFIFACNVGKLSAAKTYAEQSASYQNRSGDALMAATRARAAKVVAWLLKEGFSPDASTTYGTSALELASENDDAQTADLLLKAGASPYSSPQREYSSVLRVAKSDQIRRLFVVNGIPPSHLQYAVTPEAPVFGFLPERPLSQKKFDRNRSARPGRANPERFMPAFWYEQMRTGRYAGPKYLSYEEDKSKPIWSVHRYGRSATSLPDGRLILIAGEHEDGYHPDFCIYADVTVLGAKGGVAHFIYPEDVFPPTDFHTATLVRNHIWIIGSLGYPEHRKEGITQVLRLDLSDYSIENLQTIGENPGWIHRHKSLLHDDKIMVMGGKTEPGFCDNDSNYTLDLRTLTWEKNILIRQPS
ncbi:ankyrin repeat domain-containing protein [Thalassobius sp. I31.1]|uniref:ankyrin repeat domain-containing protein n=1 Tax=Thalassobius sp. I31.1 TaxID=2109912 RepID=UPI000D19F522|nr:ankyrin repeat domain-containing protein [Thalassobius sp. I31.1]